jgi:D-glycero-D-manno-heptose 1,7-bisphosphate phosphatase
MASLLRPALFLDRDGVLNVDRGYVARPQDFQWVPGAREAVVRFNQMGWWVFVVTNQSGIAFGYYTEADMHAVHAHMVAELSAAGGRIDEIYYSLSHPHAPLEPYRRTSLNRKPGPGMLLKAMAEYPVDRDRSLLVGDKATDLAAAEAAGVRAALFTGGNLDVFLDWAIASS